MVMRSRLRSLIRKPTDSHSYLLFSSSHPNHTKQSIPYSQCLRLRLLCSDDKDFETKSLEMRTFFVERGYPTHLLDSAIQKAFNNSHRDTLKPPLAKISDDKIPLVLTFHPFNYKVRDVISRNFQILKNNSETSAIFTDNPLISFRRNKNIRDNLVRSALRQNLPAPASTFSCSRARCYTCSLLNSATSISGPKSNFVIRHNFTCTSSDIIYCISYSKCCKLYIGETGRRLSDRFAEHLRSVRNNDVDKPVARHFNAVNHSISDMKICAISPICGGNDSRKRHEKCLIFKIGTIHPHGLNERFSFIWSHLFIVSVFVQQGWTKALTSHLFTPLFMLIHLPSIHFAPPPRLLMTLKIATDLPILASYYAFVIVFLT